MNNPFWMDFVTGIVDGLLPGEDTTIQFLKREDGQVSVSGHYANGSNRRFGCSEVSITHMPGSVVSTFVGGPGGGGDDAISR